MTSSSSGPAIVGGFTPLIAAALPRAGGNTPWLVAAALAGIALLSLICAALVRPARLTAFTAGRVGQLA